MRPISFLLVAAFVGAFAPLSVQAQDVNVSLASRYIDMNTFNDVFSDAPALQIDGSYDLNSHLYVSAYVYTGFSKPLVDDSSEYGFEVGGKWELSQKATLNLSTGRYADYQGQGFGAGDWYAKAGMTYGRASVSVSVLHGVTNTLLINSSYELPVTNRLTVTPSIAYFTAQNKLNPGFSVNYQFTEKLSVGGKFVFPKNDDTGERRFFAAATLSIKL
jgi:hypothetical protein